MITITLTNGQEFEISDKALIKHNVWTDKVNVYEDKEKVASFRDKDVAYWIKEG